MRITRRLVFVMTLSILMSASVFALWVRGTDWIRYANAFTHSHTGEHGDTSFDQGTSSFGIYSHDGWIGLLRVESGTSGLELENILRANPPDPAESGWIWSRTGRRNDYMGGLPDALIPAYATGGIPHCLYMFDGEEDGLSHFLRIQGILVNAPVLQILALGLLLVPLLIGCLNIPVPPHLLFPTQRLGPKLVA